MRLKDEGVGVFHVAAIQAKLLIRTQKYEALGVAVGQR